MSKATIVCVDDDPDVAGSISRALRRAHYNTLSTTEPEEALEMVLENDVAVLVLDYGMPNMNGVELAERVRELRPSTVRIMLTGSTDAATMLEGINRAEVYRYLTKPIDVNNLLDVVAQAVGRYRELVAIEAEREKTQLRARVLSELEARHPGISTPVRAHDGAYLVQRHLPSATAGLGLEGLLALRRS